MVLKYEDVIIDYLNQQVHYYHCPESEMGNSIGILSPYPEDYKVISGKYCQNEFEFLDTTILKNCLLV